MNNLDETYQRTTCRSSKISKKHERLYLLRKMKLESTKEKVKNTFIKVISIGTTRIPQNQ